MESTKTNKRTYLAKVRKLKGFSQSTFAKRINASVEHVRSLEYGRTNPSVQLMMKICKVLNEDPEKLFPDLMD